MMGSTHCATGVLTGLAVAPLLGLGTAETLLFAATTAGYSLVPDLDHPNARASRLLGPITGGLSYGLRYLSAWTYQRTKGPRDEHRSGTHRCLSHTAAFCLVMGGIVYALTAVFPVWGTAVALLFGLLLTADAISAWLLLAALPAAIGPLLNQEPFSQTSGWLWLAVSTGCLAHCLGDALTTSGCPMLAPLSIRGERWKPLGPPKWLRFRTGSPVENFVILPAVSVGVVLLLPTVGPFIMRSLATAVAG